MIDNKNKNKPMSNSEGGKREKREKREEREEREERDGKTYSKQVLEWRQNELRVRKCDRAQRIKIEDYRLYKRKKKKSAHWTWTKEETIRKIIFLYSTSSHIKKELIHENELYIMNDLFSFKPMADQSSVWYIYRERERRTE